MLDKVGSRDGTSAQPVIAPVDPYICPDYARAEGDRLWAKVWQIACRVEEIPNVGDYVTYDIMDESIIIVRTAAETISAYYNVCQHRGRRLTAGCGHTNQFYCRFHGWSWDLGGENTFVLDREDWGDALTCDSLRLKQVKVDNWGGWVWINMDPDCEPLQTFIAPLVARLDPFELETMRYRWRQWLVFPSNWKAAIGAFIESYHLHASHPQLLRNPTGRRFWTRTEGRHSYHGDAGPRGGEEQVSGGLSAARGQEGIDPRVAVAEDLQMMWETLNATTTETFVKASGRLVDELPPDATIAQVGAHLFVAAKADDAARGVIWPELSEEQLVSGSAIWHVFPNTVMIVGITTALCYRVRPNGSDPDSCIFEVYVIERFPEGEAPRTEWVYEPDPSEEKWRLILAQDFQNMPEVQKGMKSRGFPGIRPNPSQELSVVHFLRNLADYMDTGAPQPIVAS
jgi:phenylpropionate dioxygenase-like ring-hydroxylating dioxygenase large terminal subunit